MSDEREPPTPELNIDEKFADRIRYLTRIAQLERDLAAAQAEVERLNKLAEAISRDCNATALERNEARVEAAELQKLLDSIGKAMRLDHGPTDWRHMISAIDAANRERK